MSAGEAGVKSRKVPEFHETKWSRRRESNPHAREGRQILSLRTCVSYAELCMDVHSKSFVLRARYRSCRAQRCMELHEMLARVFKKCTVQPSVSVV